MRLAFIPTIGQRLYYMGDVNDEDTPMLKFEFCNELGQFVSPEKKERIAKIVLQLAVEMLSEGNDLP
jgi:hypothetical protein